MSGGLFTAHLKVSTEDDRCVSPPQNHTKKKKKKRKEKKTPCATRVRQLSTTTVACNRWQSYLVDAIPHPEAARQGDAERETPRCVSSSLQKKKKTPLLPADRRLPRPAVGARMLQEQLHVQGEPSTAVRARPCGTLGVVVSCSFLFCFLNASVVWIQVWL